VDLDGHRRGRARRGGAVARATAEAAVTAARRRRAAILSLGLVGALLAPARARAQDDILEAPPEPIVSYAHSAQNFAFELKFGPYRPDVDSEFPSSGPNARTPYKDFFTDNRRLLSQIEFDWQILRRVGSLGVGVGVGYFSVTGTSPQGNGSGLPSGDTSTLTVVPLSLSAVYRFDYLFEERNIPLVPYGKLGLDYAYWQDTDGNGNIATDGRGGTGRGGTLGWHATAGLALVIDFFDPEAAHDFDADLGVNHTALTFEFSHADISGLGQPGRLHLGDTTWAAGLLLEF
jgi:hypothetical protein